MGTKFVGFGLERLGLAAARAPKVCLAAIILISLLAGIGLGRLEQSNSLADLFRSDSASYANYQIFNERFPASEFDFLLMLEGSDLVSRDKLEAIRDLHLDLSLLDGVSQVISMFSLRDAPDEKGVTRPLFPAELPTGEVLDRIVGRIADNPLFQGKLLSVRDGDNQTALVVVALDSGTVREAGFMGAVQDVDATVQRMVARTGMKYHLAGVPVMRSEIREAGRRDLLVYNTSGLAIGLALCILFFRNFRLVLLATAPPALAVFWAVGLLSLAGVAFDPLMNTIAVLVIVVAFTDSMHLVFSIQRSLQDGQTPFDAVQAAIRTVGPACALASLTTAIALLSMSISDSALIGNFAIAAFFSIVAAFLAVIVVIPTLATFTLRAGDCHSFQVSGAHRAPTLLRVFCASLSRRIAKRPVAIAATGTIALIVFGAAHLRLEPSYRMSDMVPENGQSRPALRKLESTIGPVIPLQVMIRWPAGESAFSPAVKQAISAVQHDLEKSPHVGNVFSLATVQSGAEAAGSAESGPGGDIEKGPLSPLLARILNDEANSALVTGHVADLDAQEITRFVADIDRSLGPVRERYPDLDVTLTGLPVLSATMAIELMNQLKLGLVLAVVVIIGLIGVAFRSVKAMAFSVIPNLFAIAAAGAFMFAAGQGLQYSGIVALTVAFGLAADDTIHFLNRLQLEQTSHLEKAVTRTLTHVGPVLILTTLVLVLGLTVTGLSDLPPNRLFGKLCIITLVSALVGDLLLLPAIILSSKRLRRAR